MKRPLTSLLLAGALAGCASSTPQPMDPIIIPEAAVSVDHMPLYDSSTWVPINQRMLLAEAGTKHYLLIFNQPCPPLRKRSVQVIILPHSTYKVTANSDFMTVNGVMCARATSTRCCPRIASTLRARSGR